MKTNGKLNRIIKEETRKVLLEVTMEQAEARFNSKAFRKKSALEGVEPSIAKQNILKQVPQDIPERFKADALWWAISTFIKTGRLQVFTQSKNLETFFQIKEAGKGSILTKPDINQIQSWDELEQVVEEAKPAWEEYKQSKANKDWEAGSNLIWEDQNWQVFIPENKGTACKLGKGTEWCTAAPGLDYYEHYHSKEDPLIIFINKQDPEDKYQFHYKTSQFMDRNDHDIRYNHDIADQKLFYQLNEIVKRLAKKLPKETIELANQYSYEPLEDGGYKTIEPDRVSYYNEHSVLHRLDGPAIEETGGYKAWYQMGKFHRLDGPAVERSDGTKFWLQNGEYHRLDGPAIEWATGTKFWYIEGERYSEQAFNQKVKELKAQQSLREHFMRYL